MTAELSSRIHTAAVTALAFVCTYVLAFYWNLDRPFWAGFTVFVISLPSIGQTLQKGVLRMFGTIAGAVAALVLLGLFAQERMLLLSVLSLYLCLMLYLMLTSVYYGYAFFISCIVTLIICLMAVHEPQDAFHLSVYRVEETLLGIGVYTVVTLVFSPRTSIKSLYRGVQDLMAGHKVLFVMNEGAGAEGQMSRMYTQYVGMREILDKVGQLVPAVQLETYQVYRYREHWERAVRCSAELLELQRRWMGTLVAMKDLDMASLFPHFESRVAELGKLFDRLDALGKEGSPGGSSKPEDVQPLAFDESVFEKLGSTRKGLAFSAVKLFEEQTAHCRELLMLAGFLLHGGPMPELKPSASKKALSVIKPSNTLHVPDVRHFLGGDAVLDTAQPSGAGIHRFSGIDHRARPDRHHDRRRQTAAPGADLCARHRLYGAGLYLHLSSGFQPWRVHRHDGGIGIFHHIRVSAQGTEFHQTGLHAAVAVHRQFYEPPDVRFRAAAGWLFTLLFGISIVSLVHYALFMPNTEASFSRGKGLFPLVGSVAAPFAGLPRAAARLLFRLRMFSVCTGRFWLKISASWQKLPVTFVKPELVRVFPRRFRTWCPQCRGSMSGSAPWIAICCALPSRVRRVCRLWKHL
ncbi:MAG: FUSC family protein [Bilophila wadsworthia]